MARDDEITVRPATPDRWPELEAFFGPSGAYSNCWCAFFRVTSKQFETGCRDGANHQLLKRLTLEGAVPGLLDYHDGEPVGWVSVAPREQYVRVQNSRLLRALGRVDLLIFDDWGLEPLDAAARHDLLEILEDRYGRRSTIVTSQLPVDQWHALIGDPTYADAVLDRLVHNAHRIDLNGESMRRTRKPDRKA